ncbi:MAG: TonB-dependent receptor [Saprospiraceae bacterium]|nr:TonB-dependent receptor [Saprospiraceae bacterium]
MKRFLLLPALMFLFGQVLFAQSPSRITIKGAAKDSFDNILSYATVMLLNPKDTTLVNFTRSDEKGEFSFKNVRNTSYLLKISYIGYLPYQKHLNPSDSEVNDLGVLIAKPISNELMEVVIKTAKAPLRIHGDTIEYDATTFKVPPGSTVEDLLRRLPGIELDADGNIKAQGKDVNKVYVDGKTFFGADPKAATQNLGAETISKVQVYNEKSEQAKLTGVDDGKKEKVMNLELKDEYKKGAFGKVTAAVGTDERLAGRGNYNRFNEKEQLSFLAYGNNINQTGVNWEDYGEFKGQNTFNNEDNGDFGFGQGGRYYMMGGDDDVPISWFDGRGFTENFGGGTNYNFDNRKSKFNFSYFYNQSELTMSQFSDRQTFLSDTSFFNNDTTSRIDFRGNHSISTRLEHNIDSSDIIIFKLNGRLGNTDNSNLQSQLFSDENYNPVNRLNINNNSGGDTWRVAASSIYRHKFKKKGRSFALSGGFNRSSSDGTEQLYSANSLVFGAIQQSNFNDNQTTQYKSSALFTEPITKRWFWETFYNYNNTENDVNRQVQNPESLGQRIDSLSVFYKNNTLYNRMGTVVRYGYQGANVSIGLAAQRIRLQGEYARDENEPLITEPIDRKFDNLVPNVDLSYEFSNNINTGLSYSYSVTEPRLQQLQPVPNVNNPAFRSVGNPDLAPETGHSFNYNLGYWNPGSFANLNLWVEYNYFDSKIVESQTTEFINNIVRITSKPENIAGGTRVSSGLWSSYPIIKTKLTVNLSGNFSFDRSPVFVDGQETRTNSDNYNIRAGLSLTPSPKLILGANSNFGFTNTTYDINPDLSQNPKNQSVDISAKWQFLKKTFLETNFNFARFNNDRFDFNREVSIWNASIRHLIGKNNRVELRLAAFDLLNQRVTINQNASLNYVTKTLAPTLARYFMLSASYNVRGYENKIKKNEWW